MAFCPHCGQPYPEGMEFCRNCGFDLRQTPDARAVAQPSTPPLAAPKKRRAVRYLVVIVLIVILALYGVGAVFLPTSSGGRQTWRQYGMSIQYPNGVKTRYQGVLDLQADQASGEAQWLWNGGDTGLAVVWIGTAAANITAGLQGIEGGLLSSASNVVELSNGTVSMVGHSWDYLTLSFTSNGIKGYGTFAGTYYTSSDRAYYITYFDTSAGTLQNVETYGSTFSG